VNDMKYQEDYWTFRAPPTPDVADLPVGTFAGTQEQWEQLSPGMRREIARQLVKGAPTKIIPEG